MKLLERIYKEVLDESKVSENKINTAIDKHQLVVIRYNTHGERVAMANRLCGVFAHGVTKAGNECIRVFEYQGDTTTFVPGWKLIRVDRILSWFPTKNTFSSPPQDTGVGEFNPNGDRSMAIVYKVAQFGTQTPQVPDVSQARTSDSVKTGATPKQTQQNKDAAKKVADGFKPYQKTQTTSVSNEPKTAQDVTGNGRAGLDVRYAGKPIIKTDTERAIDSLRKQLDNPQKIDLSKIGKKSAQTTEPEQEKERVGLNGQYTDKPLKRTDTETAMDYLRRQLENPEKIDLSKIPKK